MTKKILFVVPSISNEEVNKQVRVLTIPYGALSLVSYVEYHCPDTNVEIIDLNMFNTHLEQQEAFKKKFSEYMPDYLCISAMFNSCFEQIAPLCEIANEIKSGLTILVGGVFATNLPQDIFPISHLITAICHGEGELPFRDLFLSDNDQKVFSEHQSWLTKEDFLKGKKCKPTFVDDLDEIPILNYSKIDINKYTGRSGNDDGFDKPSLPIHSTRGCPYNCVFCSASANHGKKMRYMSAKRFLSDVKYMIDTYHIEKLSIDDDQFLFNRERTIEILKGLAEFNIEIELASGMNVKFIDEEIAFWLKKAGLKIAVIAIESGSPRVLKDVIHKPLEVSQIPPVVKALRKAELKVHAPFIIGLPGERAEDREMSRQLILELGFDWVYIFIATPYKGSKLYDMCVENNYIDTEKVSDMNLNPYRCVITAPGINPEEITKQAYLMNLELNFVKNYNYLQGNYKVSLGYFSKLALKYPDHAFAHYYCAMCYQKLSDDKKAQYHFNEYEKLLETDKTWKQQAIDFGLEKVYAKK